MKNIVFYTLLLLLGIFVTISLVISMLVVLGCKDDLSFVDPNYLSLLPGMAVCSGVLLAILAFVRDKDYQGSESTRKRDASYLDIAARSFNEIFELLKDRNNDRVTWVRAARLLLHTKDLKNKIQTPDILQAYELAEEKLRTELYRALSVKNSDFNSRQPLPPQFFYGIEDWESESSLDNAAISASSEMVVSNVTIDKNVPQPGSKALAPESVVAIYDFMQFPVGYDDPLKKVKSWSDDWRDSHGNDQGARRYVAHKKENVAFNGKIHKKG